MPSDFLPTVSFRLTPREREYLYNLGGGTSKNPGKSASHILRALLAHYYIRERSGWLKIDDRKKLQDTTVYLDGLKEEDMAKRRAHADAQRAGYAAAQAAEQAEKDRLAACTAEAAKKEAALSPEERATRAAKWAAYRQQQRDYVDDWMKKTTADTARKEATVRQKALAQEIATAIVQQQENASDYD